MVPYTKAGERLQVVVDCLRYQRIQPELYEMTDEDSYWTLLQANWEREFFIVEQDVLVWAGAIPAMAACPSDWCTLPTICKGREVTTSFGCVKFGQGLIDRHPRLWDGLPKNWDTLDYCFAAKMQEGYETRRPCVHRPMATHLNEAHWPDPPDDMEAR